MFQVTKGKADLNAGQQGWWREDEDEQQNGSQ